MQEFVRYQVLASYGISGNDLPPVISFCGTKAVSLPCLARFLGLTYESLLYRHNKSRSSMVEQKHYLKTCGGLTSIGNPRVIFTQSGTEMLLEMGQKKPNKRAMEIILEIIFKQEPQFFISVEYLKRLEIKKRGAKLKKGRGVASRETKALKLAKLLNKNG